MMRIVSSSRSIAGARRVARAAAVVAFVAVGLPACAQASARHPKPPGCHTGRTVFRRDGIRAFVIVRHFGNPRQEGSAYKAFYVCSPTLRKAHLYDQSDPFTFEGLYDYKVFGDRLGFVYSSQGVQNGAAIGVGWVNLKSGTAKSGAIFESEQLANEDEEEANLPDVPADHLDYAIAGDGTVAVLGEGGEPLEWEVAALPVKPRSLGPPRRLFTTKLPLEGLDLDSLAIVGSSVTWRTKRGEPGSAPL
jgi:hypothetical protein